MITHALCLNAHAHFSVLIKGLDFQFGSFKSLVFAMFVICPTIPTTSLGIFFKFWVAEGIDMEVCSQNALENDMLVSPVV